MEVKLVEVTWLGDEHKGNYNGYVKIDKDSPFYEKDYDDILSFVWDEEKKIMSTCNSDVNQATSMMYILDVHGGITYARMEENDEWWIGWDSCHHSDEGKWPYDVAMAETMRLAEQVENIDKLWKAHTTYTNSQTATWHLLKA